MKLSIKIKLAIYILLMCAGFGSATSVRAGYYTESAVLSTNLLSGKTDVAQITTFKATATVPAGTAVSASYSQDGADWRDSDGVEGGWDALSAGANSIDIRVLDWTTANFYYKIKFTNTDQTATAVISQVEVEYSDTYTPYTPPWDGGYYTESAVLSTNLLSGKTDVAQITTFKATATVPAGTAVSASYSQDGADWRDSDGVEGGWDALSGGDNSIDIRVLDWTTANFYYKIKFTNTDQTATAVISQVEVEYSDTYTPYTPPWDGGYHIQGSMVSTDLLDGAGRGITGGDHFGYTISSLPANTHVYAQFSTDNANWYGSDGTLWGEDELSLGSYTSLDTALSLSALNWIGAASFYYKLRLTATTETTPIITEAGLVEFTATIVSGGSETSTINASQASKMTDGLVLMQSFDGNHMDWNQSTAEARDQSGQANHGDVIGATAAIGKIGQGLEFDGEDDYVAISDNNVIGLDNVAKATFFAWIKPNTLGQNSQGRIFDKGGGSSISSGYTFALNGDNNIAIKINSVVGDWRAVSNINVITLNTWQNVVAVYDGEAGNVDFYVNSASAGSDAIQGSTSIAGNSEELRIGIRATDLLRDFDGTIDEVRIYNRALSEDEIGDLYRMGKVMFRK